MKKLRRDFGAANPVWKAALFAVLAMLMLVLAVFVAVRPPFTSSNLTTPFPKGITANFAEEQGVLLSMLTGRSIPLIPGDVLISIGDIGATGGGTLVVEEYQADILREAGEPGWSRPRIVSVSLQDSQGNSLSGRILSQSVEICFILSEAEWQFYRQSPSSFAVQIYDEEHDPPQWQSLPTRAYVDQNRYCGRTNHLSLIALAIRIELPPTATEQELYEP